MSRRYTIYRLSAKAMLGYAKETENNIYTFDLNADATARCKVPTATHTQLGCAVKSNNVNELTELCVSLVKDEEPYSVLSAAAQTRRSQNASKSIYTTLKQNQYE